MTEKELLTGLLSTAYQMDEIGVASLYNEDGTLKDEALETLKTADVNRVQKFKSNEKTKFDDGYKKAQSESLTKFEKEIQDKIGIKSDKKGVELIEQILSEKIKSTGGVTNEDEVKKHPYVVSLLDKHQKEVETIRTEEAGKLTQFQKELNKKDTRNKVLEKASEVFSGLKPVLSQDAAKAKSTTDLFLNKLADEYEFEIQGDRIVILKDGKIFEDGHGNPVKLDKLIKENADRIFDYHATDPKSSPGNGKPDPNKKSNPDPITVPKNEAEYAKMAHDPSIPVEKKIEIRKAYEASQQTV